MQNHSTASTHTNKSIPKYGFIVAAALTDGDVIGVYRDGGTLELRWVDAQTHDMAPMAIFPRDLPIVAKLILDANERLQEGGE